MVKAPVIRHPSATEIAIAEAIDADGGALFRGLQSKWFPKIKDAYSQKAEGGRRSHYGFSGAGDVCDRALWLRWRWMNEPEFAKKHTMLQDRIQSARMKRLVNRGHLEEARFLSMLEMVGTHIEDPTTGQERVEAFFGHAGSALDALMYNSPCIPNEWHLGEFKTMNDKNFKELWTKGVRTKKPEHFVQMQLCMLTRGIHKCLYMVVNKNDDNLFTEVVEFDAVFAQNALTRINRIIYSDSAPAKIHGDPSWHQCKFCDCHALCQLRTYQPERSCRSCIGATPSTDAATWLCRGPTDIDVIPEDIIRVGCDKFAAFNL